MRTYAGQFDLIQRMVFVVDWSSFHSIQSGVDTIDDLSEDGVLAIQMGLLAVCYKELGLVRIWSRISHGNHATGVELGSEEIARGEKGAVRSSANAEGKRSGGQPHRPKRRERLMALISYFDGGSDFVFERFGPYRLAPFAYTGGIASLDHKCLDVTVENAAVIIVGSTKGEKVLQHEAGVKGRKI